MNKTENNLTPIKLVSCKKTDPSNDLRITMKKSPVIQSIEKHYSKYKKKQETLNKNLHKQIVSNQNESVFNVKDYIKEQKKDVGRLLERDCSHAFNDTMFSKYSECQRELINAE